MLQLVSLMNESNEDQVVSNNTESNQMESSDQTVVHGNIKKIKCIAFNLKIHLISYFRF